MRRPDTAAACLPTAEEQQQQQEVRTVEFTKGPGDSLGISIAGGVGSPLGDIPIFIAMMNPVGVAAQTQKLKVFKLHCARFQPDSPVLAAFQNKIRT